MRKLGKKKIKTKNKMVSLLLFLACLNIFGLGFASFATGDPTSHPYSASGEVDDLIDKGSFISIQSISSSKCAKDGFVFNGEINNAKYNIDVFFLFDLTKLRNVTDNFFENRYMECTTTLNEGLSPYSTFNSEFTFVANTYYSIDGVNYNNSIITTPGSSTTKTKTNSFDIYFDDIPAISDENYSYLYFKMSYIFTLPSTYSNNFQTQVYIPWVDGSKVTGETVLYTFNILGEIKEVQVS